MGGRKECWVTSALDISECLSALVLAKSLQRVMTSKSLVVLVSPSISNEICAILGAEFDICIRLDEDFQGLSPAIAQLHVKMFCWKMGKWKKIVYVNPHSMAVRNSDELFKTNGIACTQSIMDLSAFVVKPSLAAWHKCANGLSNGNFKNGQVADAMTKEESLENKFNIHVDLKNGFMATNLDEIAIVNFVGSKPLEFLYEDKKEAITGYIEGALMNLWQDHWENGIVQRISKLQNLSDINLNGLQTYLNKNERNTTNFQQLCLDDYKNSVAIVGMSCRLPAANNLDEFWQLLVEKKDAIRRAPGGRWIPERCGVVPEESVDSTAGFLNCSVEDFDGKFFGMSPMELSFTDPQQRLTLQVAWEALEDAAINPLSLKNTYTGVFGGNWRTDYKEILSNSGTAEDEFLRVYLGNSVGVITARISHCLGLTGPSISTESGCSSSIVAVDLACKSLLRNETDLSLACGVNLILHPFTGKSMNTVLAPDGHCKTFDASADGFARAEGCGVLVLKRYADAVRDGDRVWALI